MSIDAADDDLFRPLSAKQTTRRQFSSGGREIKGRQAHAGTFRKVRAAIARRTADQARQDGGK